MPVLIIIVVIVTIVAIYSFSNKKNNPYKEIIEQRKSFVTSLSPTAQIIVNNGTHLFFMDDAKQVFGVDDSGTTYSYSGVKCLEAGNTYVDIIHQKEKNWSNRLELGKSNTSKEGAVPIDSASISLIINAMLPIARKNMYEELKKINLTPTHEYVNRGEIWGCDINTHKFYFTYGSLYICDFSQLVKVEFDDLSINPGYFGCSYRIYVTIRDDDGEDDYWINVDDKITLNNLLAMFKGIKNRQNSYNAPIVQKSFDTMEGHEFEYFCANLLRKNGYEKVDVTQGSGDQGIDIIAYREGIKYGIQCKCYSSDIGNKAIQEVFAGKTFYECHVGVVLTNRYFTKSAIELAQKNGIILWDRDKLISMLEISNLN